MAPDGDMSLSSSTASPSSNNNNNPGIDPYKIRDWLQQYPRILTLLDQFEIQLRLGRLTGQQRGVRDRRAVTAQTIELLKTVIGGTRWRNAAALMALLKGLGRELHNAGGFREPAIGNVVRRIMAAVREEVVTTPTTTDCHADSNSTTKLGESSSSKQQTKTSNELSLGSMFGALHVRSNHPTTARTPSTSPGGVPSHRSTRSESLGDALEAVLENFPPIFFQTRETDLKQSVMEAIEEIQSDLEDLYKIISAEATSHIHSGEVILTYGRSRSIEHFLKAAADKKLKFTVVVCERAPTYEGQEVAKKLSAFGIDTILIPDSAIFAMMARVNKVILPAHAVLANGGLIAPSGSNMVALGAFHNAVPVICLTGLFKLTPMYPHEDQDTLNDLLSPCSVLSNKERNAHPDLLHDVDVINPIHDYVRPELLKLYVTNVGNFQPSYTYRVLAEHYHSDDWQSFV